MAGERTAVAGLSGRVVNPGPSKRGWHRIAKASLCVATAGWNLLDGSDGRRPESSVLSDPLIYGQAWHLLMAHRYLHMGLAQRGRVRVGEEEVSDPAEFMSVADIFRYISEVYGDSVSSDLQRAYTLYGMKYATEARDYIVHGVETQIEATLPDLGGLLPDDRRLYTQRADLVLVERATKKVWILDHKTVYRIESATHDQFIMDGQFLGYAALGANKWGEKFGGVLLGRAVVRGKDAGKFARGELPASPAAVSGHLHNVAQVELDVLTQERMHGTDIGKWRKTTTEQTCVGKYDKCEFFGRCRFGWQKE